MCGQMEHLAEKSDYQSNHFHSIDGARKSVFKNPFVRVRLRRSFEDITRFDRGSIPIGGMSFFQADRQSSSELFRCL